MLKKILALSAWTLCTVLNAQAPNEKDFSAGIFVCDEKEEGCIRVEENHSTLSLFPHQEQGDTLFACRKCR